MADVPHLQSRFDRMVRDVDRGSLPAGACWNLTDWIPDLDAPLTKRGGWSYASNSISAVTATASYVVAGMYAPFVAAAKNLAIDEDGTLYTIATDLTVTKVGAASTPIGPLSFHRNKAIIPALDGGTAPTAYDGTTFAYLAGSPPTCKFTSVYKDRTVLANSNAQPNRVFFSGAGDPTSWNTTYGYLDMSFPVTGLAALRNAQLCFSNQRLERIRGSSPPPGSDMVQETLYEPGCIDARSIVILEDTVLFCNTTGVYVTDGAAVKDVTEAGGMKRYWRDMMASYSAASWTVAAGKHRRWYVISVMNGATFVDAFMINPATWAWVRLTNLKAVMFWDSLGTIPETYWGSRATDRVNSLSSMWSPAAGVKNDGDGTAVTPIVETPWYKPGRGKLSWRRVYVSYDVQDAASDNPVLTLSYMKTPEATSYTAVTDITGAAAPLTETTSYTRVRRNLGFAAHGIAFKLAQTNASAVSRLWKLEAEGHVREASRL